MRAIDSPPKTFLNPYRGSPDTQQLQFFGRDATAGGREGGSNGQSVPLATGKPVAWCFTLCQPSVDRSVTLGPERSPRGSQLRCSGFLAPPYAGHRFSRSQPLLS